MPAISLVLGGGGLALAAAITAIFIKLVRTKRLKDARLSAARESWQSCAKKERKPNCILTSKGRRYESLKELAAAIQCEPIKSINKLWLKHAPSYQGCKTLRLLFGVSKPVLHIGMVFRYGASDRDALKSLVKAGFKLKPWEDISEQVKPAKYRDCLQVYLQVLAQEEATNTKNTFTEHEAAIVSCGEDGTNHILTDQGNLYRSVFDNDTLTETSVVEVLAEHAETVNEINTLWMKKAPTSVETNQLIDLFHENHSKPVLYIGHIHKYDKKDRQGLKDLITAGFQLKVWNQASKNVKPRYHQCLVRYLEFLKEETELYPNREPSNYTESQVAVISCGEDRVTHLLTNHGVMYRNRYHPYSHAEEQFVSRSIPPTGITDIWIKNSPCPDCTQRLRRYFNEARTKPVIHVGSIYKPDCPNNREGLLNLIQDGFKIRVWDTINTYLYGEDDHKSEQYLKALEKTVKKGNYSP